MKVTVCLLAGVLFAPAIGSVRLLAAPQIAAGTVTIDERLKRVSSDVFTRTDRITEDIAELKSILAIDPKSAEAHMLLGIAYRTEGSAELMSEAAAELRQAVALDPSSVSARFYLAHMYLDLGRPERARDELQTALEKVSGQPQLLGLLGESERQLGNAARSVELTRQALQIAPTFAEARYYLALALLDLGQRDEAIPELERVAQSGVQRAELFQALGTAHLDAGHLDPALENLQRAVDLDATHPDLLVQLARAYRLKGQLANAQQQLARARTLVPATAVSAADQQTLRDLSLEEGVIKLDQGQLDPAVRSLKKVVDLDPEYGPGHRYLAEAYIRQGLFARAQEEAARAEALGTPLPEDQLKRLREKRAPTPKEHE
jgi:tetratricopeptide (TPR) repeat protein